MVRCTLPLNAVILLTIDELQIDRLGHRITRHGENAAYISGTWCDRASIDTEPSRLIVFGRNGPFEEEAI